MISEEIEIKALEAYEEKLKKRKAYDLKSKNSLIERFRSKLKEKLGIENPRIDRKNIRIYIMKGVQVGLSGTYQDNLTAFSKCPDCQKALEKSVNTLEDFGEVLKKGRVVPWLHYCKKSTETKTHEQQIVDKLYELINILGIQP